MITDSKQNLYISDISDIIIEKKLIFFSFCNNYLSRRIEEIFYKDIKREV